MSNQNEYSDLDVESISSIESMVSENSIDVSFECPKCGYEYDNFNDSNYQPCIECVNNYCKNCAYFCDKCKREICFRCSYYMECCEENICVSCNWLCEECYEYKCTNCISRKYCIHCEMYFCKDHMSKEHKIDLCNECCDEFCYLCSELTYENPCSDCIEKIDKIIDNFHLPIEINKYILSFLFYDQSIIIDSSSE
jgi:hypothetical protein